MRTILYGLAFGAGIGLSALASAATPKAANPKAADVAAAIDRSVTWQMANPSGTHTRDWVIAPLYDGLIQAALATNKAQYLVPVLRMGQQSSWSLGSRGRSRDLSSRGSWPRSREAPLPTLSSRSKDR